MGIESGFGSAGGISTGGGFGTGGFSPFGNAFGGMSPGAQSGDNVGAFGGSGNLSQKLHLLQQLDRLLTLLSEMEGGAGSPAGHGAGGGSGSRSPGDFGGGPDVRDASAAHPNGVQPSLGGGSDVRNGNASSGGTSPAGAHCGNVQQPDATQNGGAQNGGGQNGGAQNGGTPSAGALGALPTESGQGGAIHQMDGGSTLAQNKQAMMSALDHAGASSSEKAVILAVGMQESQHMSACERDQKKDGSASENVGALNFNVDEAKKFGCADPRSLNSDSAMGKEATTMLNGIRAEGVDKALNLHRGGTTAEQDGVSYGAVGYRAGIMAVANKIQQDPSLMTSSVRVAPDTSYV